MAVTAVDPASSLAQAMSTNVVSNNFNKLDFYLVKNEVALFPRWNVYDTLYGSVKWQPNMGDTLQGLTPTPSPIQRTTFAPNVLADAPLKDIYKIGERNESAKLSYHRYESTRFRFLNSFESFWRDQLAYAHKDIVRQIQTAQNQFIRTLMWYQTPDVYISGGGNSAVGGLTSGLTLTGSCAKVSLTQDQIRTIDGDNDAISHTTTAIGRGGGQEFREACAISTATAANRAAALTLKDIYRAMLHLQEDVQAPTFDRQYGTPKTSEMIKGKYVLVCSTEAWASLLWDEDLAGDGSTYQNAARRRLAPANMNLVNEGFAGDLWGKITVKFDPHPMRFNDAGAFINPQTVTNNKVVPQSAYTKISATDSDAVASNEIAFLCGADAFKAISVGPPPKEFAGKNVSKKKLYGMNWNGQIDLTDQFLVPTASTTDVTDGGAEGWDLNVYGDFLKFISQTIHGGIPGDARHCLPIVFRRRRTS